MIKRNIDEWKQLLIGNTYNWLTVTDVIKLDNITMSVLSMGMTGDYAVAIEEGASYVRVGTGIFGERQYNI